MRCGRCSRVRELPYHSWEDHPARLPLEVPGTCRTCADLLHMLADQKWKREGSKLLRERKRGYSKFTPVGDVFAGFKEEGEAMAEVKDAELVTQTPVDALALPDHEEFAGYSGVATVTMTPDQLTTLRRKLPNEAYDILPTGEVYVSQVHYRRLLNEVFGPGAWALVPRGRYEMQGNTICREYALVGPGGRFISEAIGEAEYQPNNARMSYASACEAVKSNALTRCCKDLGIASECWERRWTEAWKAEHAVSVWRKGQSKPQWRRKDASAFYDESGPAGQRNGGDKPKAAAPSATAPPPLQPEPEAGDDEPFDQARRHLRRARARSADRSTSSPIQSLPASSYARSRSAGRVAGRDVSRPYG